MHDTSSRSAYRPAATAPTCAHRSGHYPGFPIGGWTKSWAMWIYDGTGGPVCTREIYFDYGLGEWRYVGQQ